MAFTRNTMAAFPSESTTTHAFIFLFTCLGTLGSISVALSRRGDLSVPTLGV